MLESASFTLKLVVAICCIVSLQFCTSALFLRFAMHHCPVSVRLTYCRAPWASLPPLARVAAPPARSSARCSAACPHVGLGPQPTLEAPREGLRQGEVRGGGAGRKLSRPGFETKCCGGFPGTPPGPSRLVGTDTETLTRETEFRINNELQNYKVRHIITTNTNV